MTYEFQSKLMAGFAAIAVTATLLVSSFSTPQSNIIASVFA